MLKEEKAIDNFFDAVSSRLSYYLIDPLNAARQESLFFKGQDINFRYRPIPKDLFEMKGQLEALTIPKTVIGNLLSAKRKELIKKVNLLTAIGTDNFSQASINLYGKPDKTLVKKAYKLMELEEEDDNLTIKTAETHKLLKDFLKKSGLKYKIRKKEMTASAGIYPSLKTLYLKKKDRFSQKFVKRLIVHEICTHIFRAENGRLQPLKIFFHGFPGYLVTEEGLTTYNEEITGLLTNKTRKNYAGRVIAVDYALSHSFKETFSHLNNFFNRDTAFKLTLRAKRGTKNPKKSGAYTKDHIYLKGYYLIKNYVKQGGDLKKLYVGKIRIKDLDFIKKLDLKKPIYIPEFYKT